MFDPLLMHAELAREGILFTLTNNCYLVCSIMRKIKYRGHDLLFLSNVNNLTVECFVGMVQKLELLLF